MTNVPGADADAIAIHNAFAKTVQYSGEGLRVPDVGVVLDGNAVVLAGYIPLTSWTPSAAVISAVKSDQPADPFQGAGSSARMVKFEILKSALPSVPGKDDEIVEVSGIDWSVIDITDREDIGAWHLIVERAA
ncbi:hypothetical protein [Sphingorhabdus sp. 109]|uniref:hypothetical protein n=1 Tax=Sphingorhabdus sp. 109 TaxID=2653173 RepID=UPI0012F09E62|nr:hypothetical protein [Sphingorhabdus sp. 109]VWX56716.1 conserved hypothetical protein [Sphingorhabdus sp. 109]